MSCCDFSNNDASSDFVWGANDSLTVLGNASVTADSYTQNGPIDVVGVLTINVESDFDYVADFAVELLILKVSTLM